jgi:diguanylate cyclase (GGDEF)-like protein/PAS domain S-box-containing protein
MAAELVLLVAGGAGVAVQPLATWAFAASGVLVLLGLFTFPLGHRSRQDRIAAVLDGSIVILGGLIATWVVLVLPGIEAGRSAPELLVPALAPVGGLVALVGVARIAVNPHRGSHPASNILLAIGLLGFVTAALGRACEAGLEWSWLAEPDVFVALGTVLVAVAAYVQSRAPTLHGEEYRQSVTPFLVHVRAALPYTAVAVGFWYPVDAANAGRFERFSELVLGAATLTALIIARQVVVLEHRRNVANALVASDQRYRELLEHVPTVVYVSDVGAEGRWRYVSPRVEELLGFAAEEWTRDPMLWANRIHPDDKARVLASEAESVASSEGTRVVIEYRMITRDGRVRWVRDEGSVVRPADGSPPYWSAFLTDVTERRLLEEQLQVQAFQDPLTGLANRIVFLDRIQHAVDRARRRPGSVAVLYLDLDNFKTVNDGLGHEAGDSLLAEVARRLSACIRPGDTAARMGGDEFAVLLEDLGDAETPMDVAERIHEALAHPMTVGDRELIITTSIGIAQPANRSTDGADLLRNADAAMYAAKRAGRSRSQLFEPAMHDTAVRRLELAVDMRRALEQGEFTVHYQPVVRLANGALDGLEALIRWDHPTGRLVSPAEFISLAEETGQILPIGRMVLDDACRQAREWRDAATGGGGLSVSVNVSARQLADPGFVATVGDALQRASLEPAALTLEITESMVMGDIDAAIERLLELRTLGVRIAIDDFGTGYSSLGYLRRLPVDILKVDRSLVAGVDDGGEALALAEMIVRLGRTLGLVTVAEGVERPSQARTLQQIGYELAQGYAFARPMPAAAISSMINARQGQWGRQAAGAFASTSKPAVA